MAKTESKLKEVKRRPRQQRKPDAPNRVSQTKLKKRLRDVRRLLSQETLKADVREENERALASLKHQLEAAEKLNAQDKMRKRYQKVRFVERKKAMRKLKQAERAWEQDPTPDNQKDVDKYKLDLYYTLHYPLTEKYIALYPQTPLENQQVLDRRERLRSQLREDMLHGKQKSSGSNAVSLGKRKTAVQDDDEEMSDEEEGMMGGDESDEEEESEEDEFLDLRHKER